MFLPLIDFYLYMPPNLVFWVRSFLKDSTEVHSCCQRDASRDVDVGLRLGARGWECGRDEDGVVLLWSCQWCRVEKSTPSHSHILRTENEIGNDIIFLYHNHPTMALAPPNIYARLVGERDSVGQNSRSGNKWLCTDLLECWFVIFKLRRHRNHVRHSCRTSRTGEVVFLTRISNVY